MPQIPVKDAGCLIEPPVSVPVEQGISLAATLAAEPPDDPPPEGVSAALQRLDYPKGRLPSFVLPRLRQLPEVTSIIRGIHPGAAGFLCEQLTPGDIHWTCITI